tara:strand:+ start:314 stop:568 length:255 start_codon:yes stop_codon:yes gene_type:complete
MKKLLFAGGLLYAFLLLFIIFLGHYSLIQLLDIWLDTHYFCYEFYDRIEKISYPNCDRIDLGLYAFLLTIGNIMLYLYLTQKSS